jgi:chemotaxis signal transduction protein
VSVIRGKPVPVVSLARLLHQSDSEEHRFVVLRAAGRDCALSVGSVDCIAQIDAAAWQAMPPLLAAVDAADQIRTDDQDLMFSLSVARLMAELPPEQAPG